MGIDANNTWNIWNICVREQPQNHYANPPTQRIMDIKSRPRKRGQNSFTGSPILSAAKLFILMQFPL